MASPRFTISNTTRWHCLVKSHNKQKR